VIIYAVVDDSLSPMSPLGDAIETFIRREDAEHLSRRSEATSRILPRICGSKSASWRQAR
jgi:hypothetical protein